MKNLLFITSHLYSGSEELISILNENKRVQIYNTSLSYKDPSMLNGLFSLDHTSDNTAAIYGEHLLFNQTLSSKAFYKFAKFIYVFDNAKSSLNKIINHKNEYAHLGAFRYYCFRLRRLFEMACNTPGAVLLTGDDLREQKGAELIENYLDVSVDFSKLELDDTFESVVSASIVEEAQDCYERYLYKMKQLDLKYEA